MATLVVVAGCLGGAGSTDPTESPDSGPTDATVSDPTPTTTPVSTGQPTPTATTTRTSTPTNTPPDSNASVTYVVEAGSVPDEFASLNVTLQAVFVKGGDAAPCWRGTYHGPYKPTPTPIGTPSGQCHRSDPVTVDLADLEGNRSLAVTGPDSPDDVALVATNVSATYENGSTVSGLRGVGGKLAHAVEDSPDDSYRVVFSVESYEDRPYRYWLIAETAV